MSSTIIHEVIATKKSGVVNVDDALVELVEALGEIDEISPQAELNASSISDNNGSRILL